MKRKGDYYDKEKGIKIAVVAVVIVLCGVLVLKFLFTNHLDIPNYEKAHIVFKYSDKDILAELTEEETEKIRNIINNNHWNYYDEGLSCGFNENTAIIFEGLIFDDTVCPACDGCDTLRVGRKDISISEEERKIIDDIFKKYGGYFPAV